MFDIKKTCVYIFCNKILYSQARWLWDGNCFGCDQGDEDANPILNMLLSWHHRDNLSFTILSAITPKLN
jgi:hypothetical protein